MQFISTYSSPLGTITIASNGHALIGLWFEGQKYDCATLSLPERNDNDAVIKDVKLWLNTYFNGTNPDFTPPFEINGSNFQKMVTEIMLSIPYGHTMSYKEIAQKVAIQVHKTSISAQAVGRAVGHNPISIIIPCHRVIGSNGNLTGYAGGLDRKLQLLTLEKALPSNLYSSHI